MSTEDNIVPSTVMQHMQNDAANGCIQNARTNVLQLEATASRFHPPSVAEKPFALVCSGRDYANTALIGQDRLSRGSAHRWKCLELVSMRWRASAL